MNKMNNHLYNLFNQLVQEHKSLWRIEKYYLKDSKNCSKCINFWKKLSQDKDKTIQELKKLINSHK